MTDSQHLYRDRAAPPTSGAVHEPMPEGTEADGGWHGRRKTRSRRLASAAMATMVGLVAARRRGATSGGLRLPGRAR